MRHQLTPVRMATIQPQEIKNIGEDVEEREALCTVDQNVHWCSTVESSRPSKTKTRTTTWSYNATPGYLSIENKSSISERHLHIHLHCSTIHKSKVWKWPKCLLTDKWINVVCTYREILFSHKEWNLAFCDKTNDPGGHHEKGNKSEKDKYYMISLICRIFKKMFKVELIVTENRMTVGRDCGNEGKRR